MDAGLQGFLENIKLEARSLTAVDELAKNTFVLSFARDFDFLPGQVVAVTTDLAIPPRLYSICSGTDDEEISILFTLKSDGLLTPELAKLKVGDTFFVSSAFGAFLGDEQPAWWIAAGTGIAPYRSMWRSGLGQNKKLIHGGRKADSFYFAEEFIPAFGDNYIRCSSQEKMESIYSGRLTHWLKEQQNIPQDRYYFLCGSAEMVVEVRDILINKGISIDKIMSEIYF